jgi:hypothetical protein
MKVLLDDYNSFVVSFLAAICELVVYVVYIIYKCIKDGKRQETDSIPQR